jgi:hypothetical protein
MTKCGVRTVRIDFMTEDWLATPRGTRHGVIFRTYLKKRVTYHTRLWGPPSLLYSGYRGSLPQGPLRGRSVMLTTHTHVVPSSRMSRSYTCSPPSVFMVCSGTALAFLVLASLVAMHRKQLCNFMLVATYLKTALLMTLAPYVKSGLQTEYSYRIVLTH